MPERLVPVRRYADRIYAEQDVQLLRAAGIDAYVRGGGRHGPPVHPQLYVAESQVARATSILAESPQLVPDPVMPSVDDPPMARCRVCGSDDLEPGPPYAFISLLFGAALATWVWLDGASRPAVAVAATAAVVAYGIASRTHKTRCRGCGDKAH